MDTDQIVDNPAEDELLFVDEEDLDDSPPVKKDSWKILVIDDDVSIHQVTHMVLSDFTYENKCLEILDAYSAQEAKSILSSITDIALIFLDVVMETDDAGLELVKYIRNVLQNRFVRIILRTGQPGQAPQKEVIQKYEINEYINKTELTAQKIFTLLIANLRSYSDIMMIESYRQHLEEKVEQRTYELHKKNQALILLNQEKNEFLAIAAHDLKNPLSAIIGLSEMIMEDLESLSQKEILEFNHMIYESASRMFQLVTNLLDINIIESGKACVSLEKLEISHVLKQLVNNYQQLANHKNIVLCFERDHREYYEYIAFVDKSAIYEVFDNLISNAIKYSPSGTKVYIRIMSTTKRIRCEVEDEGPGLNQADRTKLFTKFSRLSPKPTGGEHSTGLGLFIVRRLVEAMAGKIWCESELGIGTTFIVEFPINH